MLYQQTAILLIPFLGTSLGSAMVFFTKNKINEKFQKFLLGFASGVMIAASVWSLIIPSVEMSAKQNVIEWLPAAVGFLLGIGFLLLLSGINKVLVNSALLHKKRMCSELCYFSAVNNNNLICIAHRL